MTTEQTESVMLTPTPEQVHEAIQLALINSGTPVSDWRPIESAPKDGTPMLLTWWSTATQDTLPITSGFWSRLSNRFFSEISGRGLRPTHWMPLPQPPDDSLVLKKDEQSEL